MDAQTQMDFITVSRRLEPKKIQVPGFEVQVGSESSFHCSSVEVALATLSEIWSEF